MRPWARSTNFKQESRRSPTGCTPHCRLAVSRDAFRSSASGLSAPNKSKAAWRRETLACASASRASGLFPGSACTCVDGEELSFALCNASCKLANTAGSGSSAPSVHPRLTSPGSQRFRDGTGLGPGEQTDERLRFHRKTSPNLTGENYQLRPTPATCKLRVGSRFATSRRIQSSPIRVVALSVGFTVRAERRRPHRQEREDGGRGSQRRWSLKWQGPEMCTFGVLGFHTTAREPKRALFRSRP